MKKITRFFERPHRSLVKALTFRIMVIVTNGIIIYAITKRLDLTSGVIIVQTILNTILYIIHERIWNFIHWGKHNQIEIVT